MQESNIIGKDLPVTYGAILNSTDPEALVSLAQILGPEIWKGMYSTGEQVTLECRVPHAIAAALRRVLDRLDYQLSWKDEVTVKRKEKQKNVDFNQVSVKRNLKKGSVALKNLKRR